MKPPSGKPANNRTARGATGSANANAANASATAEEAGTEPNYAKEDDTLTAGVFTKALDALKSDICSKIETAVRGIQRLLWSGTS